MVVGKEDVKTRIVLSYDWCPLNTARNGFGRPEEPIAWMRNRNDASAITERMKRQQQMSGVRVFCRTNSMGKIDDTYEETSWSSSSGGTSMTA